MLMQRRWWYFNGKDVGGGALEEVGGEERLVPLLAWHIGHGMAYGTEVMSQAQATALAEGFVALVPVPRRWFTNFDADDDGFPDRWASTPVTDFTLDRGFVAIAGQRAWLAWFIDED